MIQVTLLLALFQSVPVALFQADGVTHKWTLDFPAGQPRANMNVAFESVARNPLDNQSVVLNQVGRSKLTAKFVAPVPPGKAMLEIEHLSSAADTAFGGSSLVTVKLNGGSVAENLDPGSHTFTTARLEVTKFLRRGENVLELSFTGGQTGYWLKALTLTADFPPGTVLGGKVERLPAGKRADYAIVVSRQTLEQWRPVVAALEKKYDAVTIVYPADVSQAREELAAVFPRYACFVEPLPDRNFVLAVHRLTRALDDDPYTDCLWGILTGYDMDTALRIAERREPLSIRRVAAGTGVNLDAFVEGAWYSEGEKNVMYEKKPGGKPEKKACPDDTTALLVEELNRNKPQLFVTSGHATQRDWQIGYSYKNGQFRCGQGQLFGLDLAGKRYPIQSPNPKVYVAAGNCLAGYIPDRESMALAWMKSGGVHQLVGYTVSAWYGYGAWGVNDYLAALPGRRTLAESFYFDNQSLVHKLVSGFPQAAGLNIDEYGIEGDPQLPARLAQRLAIQSRDALALLWHRDTVAFYGDPAWDAHLEKVADGPYDQELTEREGTFTFTITSHVDLPWSRPAAALLPSRVKNAKITDGEAVVTDNFILVPAPKKAAKGQVFKIVFTAQRR